MLNLKNKFKLLPIGSIKPKGWLYKQLQIQKNGLSGNLDKFWPDIMDSKWFGGNADGWERAPYWLDGVIPLAYILDDKEFKQNIDQKMQMLFEKQQDDGWPFYMEESEKNNYDLWAFLLISKVVYTYYLATKKQECITYLLKLFKLVDKVIDRTPLSRWGQFRWFEGVIALIGVYDITGDNRLYRLGRKLMDQGFNWYDFYNAPMLETPDSKGRWSFAKHVVNNAMAIKANGIAYRLTGEKQYYDCLTKAIDRLDEFHGYVTGAFSGDECLAGKSPIQGTELCAVVEYMYSLEVLIEMFGIAKLGDRLDKLAFNALPATFTPDMWAHQYDQQLNQVECSVKENRTWLTNGPDSNIFGLQPNFGCCTANLSQGWPKFAASMWMETLDNGLAACTYAPCKVKHNINNANVVVNVKSEYPFREKIRIDINSDKPVSFPLYLRIPKWCKEPKIGSEIDCNITAGEFFKVKVECKDTVNIILTIPSEISLKAKENSVSVVKGPLVYALKIDEKKVRINKDQPLKQLPHGDFEFYPDSEWRYALDIKDKTGLNFKITNNDYEDYSVFSPTNSPVSIFTKGYVVNTLKIENGSCDLMKRKVEKKENAKKIELIPYGCTNLRITEFPIVK